MPVKATARVFYNVRRFQGEPQLEDFEIREETLPQLQEGDVLLEAEWLSVDPFMRIYMPRCPVGSPMIGCQVGRVLESRNANYEVGERLLGYVGWRSHAVCNPDKTLAKTEGERFEKIQYSDVPASYFLGVLGVTGITAYLGFLEICKPKPGDVVVVTGAAGATGNVVGQIARIKGCRVIGFTGSDEKAKWLKETCGFDVAINYKTEDIKQALKRAAPEGIDCYFDNVGGATSSIIVSQMKPRGRVCVCGSISGYADFDNPTLAPSMQTHLVFKEIYMEGFLVYRWFHKYPEARRELYQWLKEGRLVPAEQITEGLENMPRAFIGVLNGENAGKAVVRV